VNATAANPIATAPIPRALAIAKYSRRVAARRLSEMNAF
jgi:hypothetical protein